ncbi:MAG: hypothetical protein J7530_08205 [Novosphingobium sp.]|nr:hypothetical protein [Novosphingobium sp.]
MKFIIMSCSHTKRTDPAPMPALQRYDGPMWRTLRALLDRHPAAARAYDSGRSTAELQIWVLSGLYGFIPTHCEVPNYEQRLTERQFAKMERDPSYEFQRIASFVDDAEAVLFAGSEFYRDGMWRASGGKIQHLNKITETNGRGIGEHRAQLGQWIVHHFGAQEALAA